MHKVEESLIKDTRKSWWRHRWHSANREKNPLCCTMCHVHNKARDSFRSVGGVVESQQEEPGWRLESRFITAKVSSSFHRNVSQRFDKQHTLNCLRRLPWWFQQPLIIHNSACAHFWLSVFVVFSFDLVCVCVWVSSNSVLPWSFMKQQRIWSGWRTALSPHVKSHSVMFLNAKIVKQWAARNNA